jgi:hypothetical protein
MFSKLSTLALAGAASLTAFGASAQSQQGQVQAPQGQYQAGLTQTCAYHDGARAGQTVNYGGTLGAVSVPIGSRCADMQGSSGQAVAPEVGRQQGGRYYSSPGAPNAWESSGALKRGYSQRCRFNSGPRAGTTANFSNTLGAQPVAIGSACSDGPSKGIAVGPGQ